MKVHAVTWKVSVQEAWDNRSTDDDENDNDN